MAFYSVRVDEDGKEIDAPRISNFSKLTFRAEHNTTRSSIQNFVRESRAKALNDKTSSNKRVRYVNSAAFIEKEEENVIKQQEPDKETQSHKSYNVSEDNTSNRQDQSYSSMENDFHVPVLELHSNESFPSSNETSYSYTKMKEITKIIQKPDAYKCWLSAKEIAKSFEAKRKKEEAEMNEQKRQERKEIAEKKYKEWKNRIIMERKKLKNQKLSDDSLEKPTEMNKTTNADKEKYFKLWLEDKRNKEVQLKKEHKERMKRECEQVEERRKKAQILYEEWLRTAPYKPKPVPLNQGFLTLKGTISDVYINPNPWNGLSPRDETSQSL